MVRGGVLIVSNRLPINITEQGGQAVAMRSIGGVATALDAVAKRAQARWVGWSGLRRILSADELSAVALPKELIPVQAGSRVIEGYYDRLANRLLWPLMHGIRPLFKPFKRDWAAYREMNRHFADAIARVVRPNEAIWIHDFHLLLVPEYLRAAGVTNPIGHFLHVPFPAPDFLLDLLELPELLKSLSKANVLGLQTERDVDNFWQTMQAVGLGEQPDLVRAFPIGIDYQAYHNAIENVAVQRHMRRIGDWVGRRRLIFSLSRLDYTKGIIDQLAAVARFLTANPERETFVYKLVVAPSREQLPEYKQLKTAIEREVRAINLRLGNPRWQPIDYEFRNIEFEEVTAWYSAADVLLLLPSTDGMNLIAKEYLAARHDDRGMLVLSTNAGAALQLPDALLVAPDDSEAAARALEQAFAMPAAERAARWHNLRAAVREQDVFWWANQFLQTLQR